MSNKRKITLTSLQNQGLLDESQIDRYNNFYKMIGRLSDAIRLVSVCVGLLSVATMLTGLIKPNVRIGDELGYSIDSDGDGIPDSSYIVTFDENGNKVSGFDFNNDGVVDIPVIHDGNGSFAGFDTNGDGLADKFIPQYNQETGQITSIDIDGHGNQILLSGDSDKLNIRFPNGDSIDILHEGDEVFIDTNGDGSGDVKVLFNKYGVFTGFDIKSENGFDGIPDPVSLEDLGIPEQYIQYMGVQNSNINLRGGMTVTPPVDPGEVDGGGGGLDGGDGGGDGGDVNNQKKYDITLDKVNGINSGTYNTGVLGIGFIGWVSKYVYSQEDNRNKPQKDSVIRKKESKRLFDIFINKSMIFVNIALPLIGYSMLLGSSISFLVAGVAIPPVLIVSLVLSFVSISLFIGHKCLNIAERSKINDITEAIWKKIEQTENYESLKNPDDLKQFLKIELVEAFTNNKDFNIEKYNKDESTKGLYKALQQIQIKKNTDTSLSQPFKVTSVTTALGQEEPIIDGL